MKSVIKWATSLFVVLVLSACGTNFEYALAVRTQTGCWGENCEPKLPTLTQIYDNLLVMRSPQPLFTNEFEAILASRMFYRNYEDEFDFIFVVYNLTEQEFKRKGVNYWGKTAVVSNYSYGIGKKRFAYGTHYGSPSRLKTVIQLSARDTLLRGPSLHEVIHTWAMDDVIPTVVPRHWGFSSANGQLGGFNKDELKDLGNGRYSAGRFGLNANSGNSIPYSPIELYLAGWIPSSEVPDLLVAKNPSWVQENEQYMKDEDGDLIFQAEGFETWSMDRIIEKLGERVPSHELARKEFQAAVILLEDEEHPASASHIRSVRRQIELFSDQKDLRNEDTTTRQVNFWTATGGRASMTMDSLAKYRIYPDHASNPASNDKVVDSSIQN